jgi:hypothetical protein
MVNVIVLQRDVNPIRSRVPCWENIKNKCRENYTTTEVYWTILMECLRRYNCKLVNGKTETYLQFKTKAAMVQFLLVWS